MSVDFKALLVHLYSRNVVAEVLMYTAWLNTNVMNGRDLHCWTRECLMNVKSKGFNLHSFIVVIQLCRC